MKEELIAFIKAPVLTNARNSMGCSENWYNPYFTISQTFSLEEIEKMTEEEISRLYKLADTLSEAFY